MCLKNYIQKHYKDYLQGKKNEEVIKLKGQFTYKMNLYSTVATIFLHFIEMRNFVFEGIEGKDNLSEISEMASYVFSVATIVKVIIFFMSIIYKPFYQLLLVNDRIITLAILISGMTNDHMFLRFFMVLTFPLLQFSNLTFTLIVIFTSNTIFAIAL